MRILPISDLHFEFHADSGDSFVRSLPEADVVVLAGDIEVGTKLLYALGLFCKKYPHVIYTPGNHEYYNHTKEELFKVQHAAREAYPNLHWLSMSRAYIKRDAKGADGSINEVFLGCTLWFRKPKFSKDEKEAAVQKERFEGAKRGMADFFAIKRLESWVYDTNTQHRKYLSQTVMAYDIVVTHHLPSFKSVDPQFEGSPLNQFFVCEMEKLILDRKPKLWIHGHTHCSKDYMLGETRVICNPFGYAGIELNRDFNDNLIIEL